MPRPHIKRISSLALTTLLLIVVSSAVHAADSWDWVDIRQLDDEQRLQVTPGCRGRYVEPSRQWRHADQSPESAPMAVSADRSEMIGNSVSLEGDVELFKGSLSLEADRAAFDRQSNRLHMDGDILLRQPGLMLRGSSAEIDTRTGLGSIEQARFLSYDSSTRATAGQIKRRSEQTLQLRDTEYTHCPPGNEVWKLRAERIHLDYESGRGVARNTTLRIMDVPVFYTPWLNFPVDDRRSTGVLWPSIGIKDSSLDLSVPLYLNLAPNYDMTLIPRFLESRGSMLESEVRYLNTFSEWELSGAYMHNDRKFGDSRWLYAVNERGLGAERWLSFIDYTRVSDDDYFRDLDIASLAIKRATHLNQQARLGYLGDRWHGRINVQQFQTIADVGKPYRRLPQLTLNYRSQPGVFGLEPLFLADYTNFDHNDSFSQGGAQPTGQRFYGETGLRLPIHWHAGHIIPAVKLRHVSYDLDAGPVERSPSTTRAQASVDMGLTLERYFRQRSWSQTLEPRLFYFYAESESQDNQPNFDSVRLPFNYQQLFRDSRFTGYDRLDDANQLGFGLYSRFISHERGREIISFGLGQLLYFDDREVQLPGVAVETHSSSDITGEVRIYPTANSWITADLLWDSRDELLSQTNLSWHYRGDNNSLYNLGYSLRRGNALSGSLIDSLEQVDASVALPLGIQWQLFARWQHDIRENRSLENLLGVSYENCCWRTRLAYRRSLEPDDRNVSKLVKTDKSILLEFQFKGLGGLGDKIATVFEESIFGYRENN